MVMTNGIKKGKGGERELLNILQGQLDLVFLRRGYQPPELKRTGYQQSDNGGYDITGLDWLALEVKRCETLNLDAWWGQAKAQAKLGQAAVLAYRQNHKPWRFRLVGFLKVNEGRALRMLADVNLSTFLEWVRLRCESELDDFEAKRSFKWYPAALPSC